MKNAKAVGIIILLFFIIYFLQANFFSWFTIAGIKPNLFILLVLFIGLFAGRKLGVVFGLIFGIYIDFLTAKSVGISGILLAIIGLLGEYFNKTFSKDGKITIILMVVGSTAIYEIITYAINIIRTGAMVEILPFVWILLIEVIYNVILTIILYPVIKKIGYYLEDTFQAKKILTRYF